MCIKYVGSIGTPVRAGELAHDEWAYAQNVQKNRQIEAETRLTAMLNRKHKKGMHG